MNPPYICVTGFDSPPQILQLDHFTSTRSRIVCGLLVSHKTIMGESKLRMPSLSDVYSMKVDIHKRSYLFAVHYCPKANSEDVAIEDIDEIMAMSPDLIQINCGNPPVIEAIVKAIKDNVGTALHLPEIVFQMNRPILTRFGESHTAVVEYFKKVGGSDGENHCLYDMSGGKGLGIPTSGILWDGKTVPFAELAGLIGKHGLVPGIAGGLNAGNIAECIANFGKTVSIDVESGVRNQENFLLMDQVNSYFKNGCDKINE